jgi:hypothetical protein
MAIVQFRSEHPAIRMRKPNQMRAIATCFEMREEIRAGAQVVLRRVRAGSKSQAAALPSVKLVRLIEDRGQGQSRGVIRSMGPMVDCRPGQQFVQMGHFLRQVVGKGARVRPLVEDEQVDVARRVRWRTTGQRRGARSRVRCGQRLADYGKLRREEQWADQHQTGRRDDQTERPGRPHHPASALRQREQDQPAHRNAQNRRDRLPPGADAFARTQRHHRSDAHGCDTTCVGCTGQPDPPRHRVQTGEDRTATDNQQREGDGICPAPKGVVARRFHPQTYADAGAAGPASPRCQSPNGSTPFPSDKIPSKTKCRAEAHDSVLQSRDYRKFARSAEVNAMSARFPAADNAFHPVSTARR